MIETAAGWSLDVDRGPDWLFVRVHPQSGENDAPGLAESVWHVLEQSFIYRVVVELHDFVDLRSSLIGQLVLLSKRVHSQGGILRLCGLSPANQEVLRTCRLQAALPSYWNRGDAVMGHRPLQPR
jgi:anti-anti-sigma regulatory factor